jgi:predicted NBD/HSP70 family sugar kinase
VQAKAAIGVDVGGTRVKAVVVEDEGTILDQVVRPSLEDGVERWAEVTHALVGELIGQYGEELFVGVCAPGLADSEERCIWNLPNRMPGIEGLVWQRFLGRPQAVPTLNDAQDGAFGRAVAGRSGRTTKCDHVDTGHWSRWRSAGGWPNAARSPWSRRAFRTRFHPG